MVDVRLEGQTTLSVNHRHLHWPHYTGAAPKCITGNWLYRSRSVNSVVIKLNVHSWSLTHSGYTDAITSIGAKVIVPSHHTVTVPLSTLLGWRIYGRASSTLYITAQNQCVWTEYVSVKCMRTFNFFARNAFAAHYITIWTSFGVLGENCRMTLKTANWLNIWCCLRITFSVFSLHSNASKQRKESQRNPLHNGFLSSKIEVI